MRRDHRVVDPNRAPKNFGGCSALALMTKAPRAGQVKTRLVPPLTNEEAAQLNRWFLQDSDSPPVPAENFAQAIELLSLPGDRIVLGPCDDGGYYLIGLKRLHREVFERIDWSTEQVFEQTRQRATQIGITVHELPRGFDVDDRTTLHRLCDELL